MHDSRYLLDVILILASGIVAVLVFQRLRQASVLGYLIAGAAIGPYAAGLVRDLDIIRSFAELGVVFLLFNIGLELPLGRLRVLGAAIYGLGFAQIFATGAIAAGIAMLFGQTTEAAVVIGGAIALSSTVIVVQLLIDRGELTTRLGRTAFAILLVQDLAVGPLLIMVHALGGEPMDLGMPLLLEAGKTIALLIGLLIVGLFALRPLFRLVAASGNEEAFAGTTLLVVLCAALLTESSGLSLALGGLIAGVLLAETEFRHQIAAEIRPVRGLLLGLFFMSVGMAIDLRLAVAQLPLVLALVAAIIAGKAAVLASLALALRTPMPITLPLGLMLAQGGEFAFVLFAAATMQGLLEPALAQLLLVAIALTMLASPLLVALAGRLSRSAAAAGKDGRLAAPEEDSGLKDHVIIGGYGRVGRTVGMHLKTQGVAFIAVDLDPERVRLARERGENVFYGDASRPEILDALNPAEARAVVIAMSNPRGALQLVGLLHYLFPDLPIHARAHDDEHAEALRAAGAHIVVPELIATGDRLAIGIGPKTP